MEHQESHLYQYDLWYMSLFSHFVQTCRLPLLKAWLKSDIY